MIVVREYEVSATARSRWPLLLEVARRDRDRDPSPTGIGDQGCEGPVAIAQEHDDVVGAELSATARSMWPLPKSPATIAIGRARRPAARSASRLERAVAVAQGDRDAVGAGEGDGQRRGQASP